MENTRGYHGDKTAIIIGAGPAGLTAAYELVTKTDIKPIIFEADSRIGGISKTINFKGWRFDIGPHRFFTKSKLVQDIWDKLLPELSDDRLEVKRLTRIYHGQKFFDYPIKASLQNIKNLGLIKIGKIIYSYILSRLKPIRPEISLEDFFINRFGSELYKTFFKSYTEKVWGLECQKIPKSWGAQRVKNLSISKIFTEAIKKIFSFNYKTKETSLIDSFLYPKMGAGQMYEKMASIIEAKGGKIYLNTKVKSFEIQDKKIVRVKTKDSLTGESKIYEADYFFSSQNLKELVSELSEKPMSISEIASGLVYRNLVLVVLVYNKLSIKNNTKIKTLNNLVPDNWIYVQEEATRIGRLDIFNNFSPALLKNTGKVLLGAEFFCSENDSIWKDKKENLINLAKAELAKIGIAAETECIESTIYRQAQAYPAYFGTYKRLNELKDYLNSISNLYLIGRNGLHRYNNMDHSMLSAITAVDNIISGRVDKNNIWEVNTEDQYHE